MGNARAARPSVDPVASPVRSAFDCLGWRISHDAARSDGATPIWTDATGALEVSRPKAPRLALQLSVDGHPLALIDAPSRIVTLLDGAPAFDPDTLAHHLLDQVLPRALAHEGRLVIHAGAAVLEGRAALILGPSGAGKSTLTGALAASGHPLLSDDAILLDGDPPLARPTYPGLRLLPDSLRALFPRSASDRMADYSPKRRVGAEAAAFAPAAPLGLILRLGPPGDALALRPLPPAQACMALVANAFALDPTDAARNAARLAACGRIAARTPAYALGYPHDYAMLADVVAALRAIAAEGNPE